MFALTWSEPALDALADVFVNTDLTDQEPLAAAVETMNRQLTDDPFEVGESRSGGFRLAFIGSVMILFRVNRAERWVRVSEVAPFGR